MKILSKKTGMIYDYMGLETRDGEDVYIEDLNTLDLASCVFAWSTLCDDCLERAGKLGGCAAGGCSNEGCQSEGKFWEVSWTEEEIQNDLIIYTPENCQNK